MRFVALIWLTYYMSDKKVKIAWFGKHFGEEPPLTGTNRQGAGGIFFSGCNLRCVFCQNYQISQESAGKEYSIEELAGIMLQLQNGGAINIDLVSPILWWKQIGQAIDLARTKGLKLPIIWNSNGFEPMEILKKMRGKIDIYLPDFKYGDDEIGFKCSGIKNYSVVAAKALKEMLAQTGYLKIENELAVKGVIVRHLILPNNLENSFLALEKIAAVDRNLHLSLMSQYFPAHRAKSFPELSRPLIKEEFEAVCEKMEAIGFANGWFQELSSAPCLLPDFNKINPFNTVDSA